ncbi:MarR family winged helix-turn-helix transcriptional regulator [Methylococcus sp. EFPC2]|uniref:MarR family winged helix-turn-helix transcriptional regulator n=1 Tax=Methylococcus sp. EFPC2 TaxID=2812648 RepID=UPI0019682B06|nr:MarR family winged helix-turn-helix transcriptional regulator [Methylococcus sp. EFPC2]QSA96089.1 winged helix-turn-helix transcriptional regulator [Methylococcus sp. EFPC2]
MLSEPIYEYLERIANLLRTDTRKLSVGRGLQPVQLEALRYLSHCNRYSNTPAAVTDYLGLTKGTVSQTLGVLEMAGLVEKRPDLKDRRVIHLVLTEAGRQAVRDFFPPGNLESAVEIMSAEERASAVAALDSLLQALQKSNQLKTFGVCKTCRYHKIEEDDARRCTLTGEQLQGEDIDSICREHQPPSSAAAS